MAPTAKTLFAPVVPQGKLHPLFDALRNEPASEPARWMLDDIYQTFRDPEGNFLEQFQTTGFNSRFFELYMFAYLTRTGFDVEREVPNPDFLVERDGLRVAIEATTVNPPTSGVLARQGKKLANLTEEEMGDYLRNELAIRFGSPLRSKLSKRYRELPHCKGLPLVIAIEAFHEKESLALSDWSLARYLYGLEQTAAWDAAGILQVGSVPVTRHKAAEKTIPSSFFKEPAARFLSAVAFTNSGTSAKFSRMGYQHGIGVDSICMLRTGFSYNPDPDAMDPTLFSYDLDAPPFVETWGQGLIVFHNPFAEHPLPKDFFVDAVEGRVENELLITDGGGWHPVGSETAIIFMGEHKAKLRAIPMKHPRVAVAAISKLDFHRECDFRFVRSSRLVEESGWFRDETGSFLGLVLHDQVDDDWGFAILARDKFFHFRAIETGAGHLTRERARVELQNKIALLVLNGKRIFN